MCIFIELNEFRSSREMEMITHIYSVSIQTSHRSLMTYHQKSQRRKKRLVVKCSERYADVVNYSCENDMEWICGVWRVSEISNDEKWWVSRLDGADAMDRGEWCCSGGRRLRHTRMKEDVQWKKNANIFISWTLTERIEVKREKKIEGDEVRMWENESSFKNSTW